MIWNHSIPQPPVPKELREMLKDYPEYLQKLQDDLLSVVTKPSSGALPFEVAVLRLQDGLSALMLEASSELDAAIASGDAGMVERAKKKDFAVGYARANLFGLLDGEFDTYFKLHRGGA